MDLAFKIARNENVVFWSVTINYWLEIEFFPVTSADI